MWMNINRNPIILQREYVMLGIKPIDKTKDNNGLTLVGIILVELQKFEKKKKKPIKFYHLYPSV